VGSLRVLRVLPPRSTDCSWGRRLRMEGVGCEWKGYELLPPPPLQTRGVTPPTRAGPTSEPSDAIARTTAAMNAGKCCWAPRNKSAETHTHTDTHTNTNTQTDTHTNTNTQTHTHTDTHTNTNTQTHTHRHKNN